MARANQHWSATQSEAMLGGREVQQPPTHLSSPQPSKGLGGAASLGGRKENQLTKFGLFFYKRSL